MRRRSHLEPLFAIVAENEVGHWLVGSLDLHLDEASFGALTVFAREQSLELLPLGFHLLSGPVRSLVLHIGLSRAFSRLLHLV